MLRNPSRVFAIAAGLALLGGAAFAADPAPGTPPTPTPAQRQTMAEIHRKMAECLVSDAPIETCRAQMHANCISMMGQTGCPMLGMGPGGGPGRGMMRGPGMMYPGTGTPPPAPPQKP